MNKSEIAIYQTADGLTKIDARLDGETVWLTLDQMAALFERDKSTVSRHIKNVFDEEELDRNSVVANFATTAKFFSTVQNKLHFAVHEHTAAEVIYNRVDNEKPIVGMTNFRGGYITKDDVKIAKNYLNEKELQRLNLLVSQFLDFAEFQALEQNTMAMQDWITALDNQIINLKRKLLIGKGKITHKQAITKAEKEFELYRAREMKQLESDFDRAVRELTQSNGASDENE